MAKETLRLAGYREFVKACNDAPKNVKREVREAFRQVGEVIRHHAAARFQSVDARTAAGYRVRVRQRGIAVEQSIRRTTGLHPEYGALQMREALLPAMVENEDDVERETERAMDAVSRIFETHPRGA